MDIVRFKASEVNEFINKLTELRDFLVLISEESSDGSLCTFRHSYTYKILEQLR